MPRVISSLFDDPAIRYGIKFGLAGMLAVFIALVIRLPMPAWALFTVFVLMIAQYVGAIGEKSIFRVIGTIVGGVIGYLLTATLEQQPIFFLSLVGLIVGFCTAMFGQSRYPYAFFLCGLTVVVVTSNGLKNPDMSWQFMLYRIEEVGVGILAAVIVQSLLWPRYARMEFLKNAHASFADLKNCFANSAHIFFGNGNLEATQHAEGFPARISALRELLDFGARESQFFRDRLPTYFEITTCLNRIASAIVTLEKSLPENSFYRTTIQVETEALHQALEAALDDLGEKASTSFSRSEHRKAVDKAFQALEKRLIALRSDPTILSLPVEETLTLGLHMLALDEIRQQIHRSHELFDSLPVEIGEHVRREPEPFLSPIPPPFWIKSGIKSGIAIIIALLIENWLQPPGGTMFVLGTWVFTAMNATSPGGRGDSRAFHYVIYNIAILIFMSLLLLLTTPMLSSYAVMNILLFTWLFVWGYLSYSTHGITVPMQMAMLLMIGILNLNGQEPVSFQSIGDFFFGLALAVVLAALIQRLLWPSLPQWEMRDRFVEFFCTCRRILKNGLQTLPLWQKTRIALIPGEANLRIDLLHSPICPPDEPERLRNYLKTLQRVGSHLVVSAGRLAPLLPSQYAAQGKDLIAQFEAELEKQIETHESVMKKAIASRIDSTELFKKLAAWKMWVTELRAWMLVNNHPPLEIIRFLGLSGRYEEAARDLLKANEQAGRLRLPLYMGDYVL